MISMQLLVNNLVPNFISGVSSPTIVSPEEDSSPLGLLRIIVRQT